MSGIKYTVEHHGTSGTWYAFSDEFCTMFDALTFAEQIKADGYGVRVVRDDGSVAMSAPWQEAIDWSVAK